MKPLFCVLVLAMLTTLVVVASASHEETHEGKQWIDPNTGEFIFSIPEKQDDARVIDKEPPTTENQQQ